MALELKALIPATPDEVFSVLADPDHAREWMPAVQKIERLDDRPFGVGTSWRETRLAGKRTMESTIRVVACERGSKLGLRVESSAMEGDLAFTLKPTGPGTEVHYSAAMKGRGFMRLMTGTINKSMAQEDADLLTRLENQVAKSR
jgi:carbon monoxide dehydrogenase subunit G